MRVTTRLALALAIVGAGLSAPTAYGVGAVEIINEKTGTHCGATLATACTAHAVGAGTLVYHEPVFGMEITEATCAVEAAIKVTESGATSTVGVTYAAGDANCAGPNPLVRNCELPWLGTMEETAPAVVTRTVDICIETAEVGFTCEGTLVYDIVEEAPERYAGWVVDGTFDGESRCELDLSLEFESDVSTNAALHINHL